MAAKVRAMGADEHVGADHGPYIRAVCNAIEARDIRVTEADIDITDRHRRTAWLTVRPEQETFAEPVPAEAHVLWDERNGWSLRTLSGPLENLISKGLDVLPGPDNVAAWVVVALTHPELTPSYEGERAYRLPDAEFDARLARYTAAS